MTCKGRITIFCSHLRSGEFASLICIQNWVAVNSSEPVCANHYLSPQISTHCTSKLQDTLPQWSYCLDLQCLVWYQYEFHNFLIYSCFFTKINKNKFSILLKQKIGTFQGLHISNYVSTQVLFSFFCTHHHLFQRSKSETQELSLALG